MLVRKGFISKVHLAQGKNFSIAAVIKYNYTHYIQISQLPMDNVLVIIPFDPASSTVAGVIDRNALIPLGEEAEIALQVLSEVLTQKVGAQEFLIIPEEKSLQKFVAPENCDLTRHRHCDRAALLKNTARILAENKEAVLQLDRYYHFVSDEATLMSGRDVQQRYQEISEFLQKARNSKDNVNEHKNENLQIIMSCFRSDYVKPIVMLDKKDNIVGLIRALIMGNGFAYLSDEVINQTVISAEYFTGESIEERNQNKERFLLAYFLHVACNLMLTQQTNLIILPLKGREKMYDLVGCSSFPMPLQGCKAVAYFGPEGNIFKETQERIRAIPLPVSVPIVSPVQQNSYLKYFGIGVALIGVGLFVSRLQKDSSSVADASTFKPKL